MNKILAIALLGGVGMFGCNSADSDNNMATGDSMSTTKNESMKNNMDDKDGMPDKWEKENELNMNDPKDAAGYKVDKGYTNIEAYLNGLVK